MRHLATEVLSIGGTLVCLPDPSSVELGSTSIKPVATYNVCNKNNQVQRTKTEGRIPALLDGPGYHAANQAFLNRWSSDHDELLYFIREHAPRALQSECGAEAGAYMYEILSVGSGDGRRDEAALDLLEDILPESTAVKYSAVDPSEEQMEALRGRFETRAATGKRSLLAAAETMTAEAFDFPRGKYDLILFTHSLYHMPGSEKEVMTKAIGALRPNGRIIVALSTERGGIFQMMGSFWQTIDYSRFEVGDGLFGQESLMKLLNDDDDFGVESCLKLKKLPDVYIDVSVCLSDGSEEGRHLLNFVLQSDTAKLPTEVNRQVLDELKVKAPISADGKHYLSHGSGIFLISGEIDYLPHGMGSF
jgi:SAM-dependent methyltransferase